MSWELGIGNWELKDQDKDKDKDEGLRQVEGVGGGIFGEGEGPGEVALHGIIAVGPGYTEYSSERGFRKGVFTGPRNRDIESYHGRDIHQPYLSHLRVR